MYNLKRMLVTNFQRRENALRTFDHHQEELFDGEDLPHEEINNGNEGAERLTSIEEDEETELVVLENGRLKGRFVSGSDSFLVIPCIS